MWFGTTKMWQILEHVLEPCPLCGRGRSIDHNAGRPTCDTSKQLRRLASRLASRLVAFPQSLPAESRLSSTFKSTRQLTRLDGISFPHFDANEFRRKSKPRGISWKAVTSSKRSLIGRRGTTNQMGRYGDRVRLRRSARTSLGSEGGGLICIKTNPVATELVDSVVDSRVDSRRDPIMQMSLPGRVESTSKAANESTGAFPLDTQIRVRSIGFFKEAKKKKGKMKKETPPPTLPNGIGQSNCLSKKGDPRLGLLNWIRLQSRLSS